MTTNQHKQSATNDSPFHMGDRIRKARELAGYGANRKMEFAQEIGIDRATLAKYEDTGKAKRAALISIAWNTPVTLEWLETGSGPIFKSGQGPDGGGTSEVPETAEKLRFGNSHEVIRVDFAASAAPSRKAA